MREVTLKKCQENLINVQRLHQWLPDGIFLYRSRGSKTGCRCGEEVGVPDEIED